MSECVCERERECVCVCVCVCVTEQMVTEIRSKCRALCVNID